MLGFPAARDLPAVKWQHDLDKLAVARRTALADALDRAGARWLLHLPAPAWADKDRDAFTVSA